MPTGRLYSIYRVRRASCGARLAPESPGHCDSIGSCCLEWLPTVFEQPPSAQIGTKKNWEPAPRLLAVLVLPPLCICMHIYKHILTCVWHYVMMRTHIFVYVCVCALMQKYIYMFKLNSDKWTTNNNPRLSADNFCSISIKCSSAGPPCPLKMFYLTWQSQSIHSYLSLKTHSVPSQSNFWSNIEANSISPLVILKYFSVGALHCIHPLFPSKFGRRNSFFSFLLQFSYLEGHT